MLYAMLAYNFILHAIKANLGVTKICLNIRNREETTDGKQ